MRTLNINNFFLNYIRDPLSKELTTTERVVALVASIALAIFALLPHLISHYLSTRKFSKIDHQKKFQADFLGVKKIHDLFATALQQQTPVVSNSLPTEAKQQISSAVSRKIIPEKIQYYIDSFYRKALPQENDVEVPYNGGWVKWSTLSPSEKVKVINAHAHAHDKLPENVFGEALADLKLFTTQGQSEYLPNDPRHHHGSDHCVRTAIFAAVFGYLYKKYHPQLDPSQEEIFLAQIVAAAHDSGREAEGPDLWDERSSDRAIALLQAMGINDPTVIAQCRKAIAEKDEKNLKNKSFFAKCVQNADSAEFSRLSLNQRTQSGHSFEISRGYLDIFNEMKSLSDEMKTDSNNEPILKNGLTFSDFKMELDAVRAEMNCLIFRTHRKKAREESSEPGKNYYSQILNRINTYKYPLLKFLF